VTIEALLQEYAVYRENARRVERWENNVPVLPRHFEEYLHERYNQGRPIENPLCHSLWDSFCAHAQRRIFDEGITIAKREIREIATRSLAYSLWERLGGPLWDADSNWFEAERILGFDSGARRLPQFEGSRVSIDDEAGKRASSEPPAAADTPEENADAATAHLEAVMAYPRGLFGKQSAAEHEGAHGIVDDHIGCTVEWINISVTNGKLRKTKITIPNAFFVRDDSAVAFDLATSIVAGPVAQKAFDNAVQLVSEQLTSELMEGYGKAAPDVVQVLRLLRNADILSVEKVVEAEQRARNILRERHADFWRTVDRLMEFEYLEGEPLAKALGKYPKGSAPA
jgi:hypothetical protein